MSNSMKWAAAAVLAVLGVLALIAGIIYLAVPFRNLPGFLPGHKPGYGVYHLRGGIAVVIALVLLGASLLVSRVGRRGGSTAADESPAPAASDSSAAAQEGASA